MLKKFLISLWIIMIIVCTTFSYATNVKVTNENLNAAFQKYVSSDANTMGYEISVADNIININVNNEEYKLNYDLTDKPTFSMTIPIEKGMEYQEFKNQTSNLILPMLGYIAVTDIQGVELEDASEYFLMTYLNNALKGDVTSKNSYIIIDDVNLEDGVTIDKTESSDQIIYVSEFGERVMEYVNATYKDKQIIRDASDEEINSYEYTVERKEVTDTSCEIVATLSVNLDADFSKLNGYSDQEKDDTPAKKDDNTIVQDNKMNNGNVNNDKTTSKTVLPKAGMNNIVCMILFFSVVLVVVFIVKLKKYKDV